MYENIVSTGFTALVSGALILLGLVVLAIAIIMLAKGKRTFSAAFRGLGIEVNLNSTSPTAPGDLEKEVK